MMERFENEVLIKLHEKGLRGKLLLETKTEIVRLAMGIKARMRMEEEEERVRAIANEIREEQEKQEWEVKRDE